MASTASTQLPECPLFRPRSMKGLPLFHRKRCEPNPGERIPLPAKTQNFDALTVQLNPMRSVPLQMDYVQSGRDTRQNTGPSSVELEFECVLPAHITT